MIAGSLHARTSAEAIEVALHTLETEESITESQELSALLEHYEGLLPPLIKRYHATDSEYRKIEAKFVSEGVPSFFAAVPYCESKFKADAHGYGTAGLWQFSKQSARNFGLKVKKGVDERLDPSRSTEAAIAYIKDLKRQFGSWYLADFAYTMGEGKLKQMIQRNGSRKLSVLLKDPHFPPGSKAHFAKTLLLHAYITSLSAKKSEADAS